jgi:SAM-dependent methyltransferase
MVARDALGLNERLAEAYHRVREPLYRQILDETLPNLRQEALILDAGCGDAFYSRLLANHFATVNVVALDLDKKRLTAEASAGAVHACQADLERAGLQPGVFDAIWLCRAMHSALDPLRRLQALAPLLRPAGRLVVVENDFGHHPLLSWPADFERQVLEAHLRYLQRRTSDGTSLERYFAPRYLPAWLTQAGLRLASIRTHVSLDVAPMPAEMEAYWALFIAWLRQRIWPLLSPQAQDTFRRLCESESPDYVLASAGFCCAELTTVVCAYAPSR